jgi:hypothetical protein
MASNALVLIPAMLQRPRHNEIFLDVADRSCEAGATVDAVTASSIVVADMTSTIILADMALHQGFAEDDSEKHVTVVGLMIGKQKEAHS